MLHRQHMHAPYSELLYLFDAPSSVANFHDFPLYPISEWSLYSGTLPFCHVPLLYRDLDCIQNLFILHRYRRESIRKDMSDLL